MARLFIFFALINFLSLLAGIIILLLHNDTLQAIILSAGLLLVLSSFSFIKKKEFERAAIFLAVIMFLLITIVSTSGLGIHHIANFGFPAILIIASLVIRKRTLLFLTVFAILCTAWLVFGELLGLYTPASLEKSVPGDFFTVTTMLIATSIMVRLLTESLFQASLEVQKELTERKRAEERLAHDALHDALTNLPNRTLFVDRLGQRLEHARRHPQHLFAVFFMDLDRFKVVNDSLGHPVGDQLLVATARRLSECVRPQDTVSRLSGDEFAILLDDFSEVSDAVRVAKRIQAHLSSTSMLENINWVTAASIGIAIYNGSYTTPQELLRDADSAMYRAKAMGGGHYKIFDDTMYASAVSLLQLEADLKRAVENQEWRVHYQPITSLPDRKIVGMEALVRWNHPHRGLVYPNGFIDAAEETGHILPMGEYVLCEVCRQVKTWREGGYPDLWVSVNLSGRQFQDQNLLPLIERQLAENSLCADCLQLEITETVAMKDFDTSIRVMNKLNLMGIQISVDDFGTGYSSLGYLNRFPIKVLKIDGSFIHEIDRNRNSQAITAAIVSLSHALGMKVVAEGVETKRQLAFLQSIDCDMIQGNLISPAAPTAEIEKLLRSKGTSRTNGRRVENQEIVKI